MKTSLLLTSIIVVLFIGCEKESVTNDHDITASLLNFTDCNYNTKSSKNYIPSVRLIGKGEGVLLVQLENTEFCCGTDSVSLSKIISNNAIEIEIIDNGPYTYCYCPHNLDFEIGSLLNQHYELTIIESETAYSRDTFCIDFTYSQNLDTTFYGNDYANYDQINLFKTIEGGCNIQSEKQQTSPLEESVDTVIVLVKNDTIDLFVGINYICCAPFMSETETEIENDSILISLTDTCSFPYQSCYCRCMCYYTWDFIFTDYQQKIYNYKITLIDPGEEQPIVFKEGKIEITD